MAAGEEGYEEHVPLIVLSKQGDILSGELRNFEYTCAPTNTFEVFSKISPSYQGMDTLSVYCEHPKGGLTTGGRIGYVEIEMHSAQDDAECRESRISITKNINKERL